MRCTFRYNPETRTMEEVSTVRSERYHAVHGDVHNFVSPITGEPITDRGRIRRHMKVHGIAYAHEMEGVAKRVREQRAKENAAGRIRDVCEAYERRRDEARAKARFG